MCCIHAIYITHAAVTPPVPVEETFQVNNTLRRPTNKISWRMGALTAKSPCRFFIIDNMDTDRVVGEKIDKLAKRN